MTISYKSADFWLPELSVIAKTLDSGLSEHFAQVDVSVVDCPDLTEEMQSAGAGLCGSTKLFEFGGEPYAHNPEYRGSHIDIKDMLEACQMPQASILGAAMAESSVINGNCGELIPHNHLGNAVNNSRVARVGEQKECIIEPYPAHLCGPIANLFVSDGEQDKVLRVELKKRISEQASLPQAIRESLRSITEENGHIGLGGIFKILQGQVKSHVMPNYACIEDGYYDTAQEKVVRDFLQFYDHMGPDLLCFTTLWTGDPSDGDDLNLRTSGEHTHFYHTDDEAQQGGHYHGDVTPDDVHYVGYFNLAESICRFGDIYAELGLKP
ncbi:MAG: DUF1907 domain-containing protein [Arenicella sp.]